ncbi:glycosyltransferase [Synechococcus sp. MIT S9510]
MHIRFYGHLRAGFGLAGGAKATARCLEAAGCQLSYVDLALASHAAVQELPCDSHELGSDDIHHQVDFVHTNPNILSSNPELLERHPLTAPLRIGYWAWELEQFPAGWERFFGGYHEIWCPSSFTAQALAQRSPVPVIALPHLPDWSHLRERNQARKVFRQTSDARPFTFLTLFDFWSTPERKNPEAVIRAFQQAFPRQDNSGPDVQLLVKASSAEQFPEQARALKNLAKGDRRVRWIEALLPQAELDALYDRADALVSLHRSEGFGLTLADAMGMGIPVIATGYSGNLDFMPPGSAELIPWSLRTIERTRGDYMAGTTWAEPDIKSAAKAMRRLAMNSEYAVQLGLRGQKVAQERLSSKRLSAVVRQRLGRWWLPPNPAPVDAAAMPAPSY